MTRDALLEQAALALRVSKDRKLSRDVRDRAEDEAANLVSAANQVR